MARDRPRILFIAGSAPHGKTFGGQLRSLHTARALKGLGEVTFAVVSTDVDEHRESNGSSSEFEIRFSVVPQLALNRGLISKLRWYLDPRYLNVHGCMASP